VKDKCVQRQLGGKGMGRRVLLTEGRAHAETQVRKNPECLGLWGVGAWTVSVCPCVVMAVLAVPGPMPPRTCSILGSDAWVHPSGHMRGAPPTLAPDDLSDQVWATPCANSLLVCRATHGPVHHCHELGDQQGPSTFGASSAREDRPNATVWEKQSLCSGHCWPLC
jgi:hypothetical protein